MRTAGSAMTDVEVALGDDLAQVHHHGAVDHLGHHGQVVLDQHHGHPLVVLDLAQHGAQLPRLVDVEPRRRLVGHEDHGVGHQGPGQLHQPARPQPE